MKAGEKYRTAEDTERLLRRGVAEIIVEEEMIELLRSGKKLRLKEGFDPSFPDIHLGHMVALRKLRQFQELGHQVILIVGDWTAQIGDPSGVSVTRPMLSAEQVQTNAETYMKQFFKVVDREKTEVRWQSEWFGEFGLADVIRLTSKFTIAQMLARDDFSARYNAGRPIAITELLYPLLQAYDSVAVQADAEFGGTDQKFNFLVGRELQSTAGQRPQQCFMTPLLVGTDGSHKMSKSLGNYIGVAEPPYATDGGIYGKVMSIPDSLILQYFELVTDVSGEGLEEVKKEINKGTTNPMIFKKRLAGEIVAQLYSRKEADEAEEHFKKEVQEKQVPEEIPQVEITKELLQRIKARTFKENGFVVSSREVGKPKTEEWTVSVPLLLCEIGLAKSRSDARRLIKQEAVRIDNRTIYENYEERGSIKIGSVIQVGKRRWVQMVKW
ncbi:tyrosine--tRNA ligase [Chloroflexota bacterium]